MSEQPSSQPAKVRFFEVSPDQAGQRLDNFLRTALKGVPKTLIYRLLRKGEIRVNKKRAKPDTRIEAGDSIRVAPVRISSSTSPAKADDQRLQALQQTILYEDDALLIINKPSGLAVHGGSGIQLGLIEMLRQLRPDAHFLELVHRLDRDTSGCIMVAKKRSMLRYMHQQLRDNRVNKIYHALVAGRWSNRVREVSAPLLKNELKSGERIVKVDVQGRPSLTRFRVLNRFASVATLVEAKPVTGRTHQIRVHAQFAGHPIVGDPKYGIETVNRTMKGQGIRRLFLHAARLEVDLADGQRLCVEAPLEPQLQQALTTLLPAQVNEQSQEQKIDE